MRTPLPKPQERPTSYADRVGEWYASQTSDDHKTEHGQYLTPPAISHFMASAFNNFPEKVRILDPGAGSGTLTCALCERIVEERKVRQIELVAYETEPGLISHLKNVFNYAREWAREKNVNINYIIHSEDFILDNAHLFNKLQQRLFPNTSKQFDFIISNPPYFKIPKEDPRARAAAHVVYGQPNIYALFMAVSALMLKPKGQMVFIVPRSFTAGPYFRRFREVFFNIIRPLSVHLFDSRTEAFARNEILQEHIILSAIRDDDWHKEAKYFIKVSISSGLKDIKKPRENILPVKEVLDVSNPNKFFFIPSNEEERKIITLINSWKGSIHKYGLEISTGPVVPFRAIKFITEKTNVNSVPLLWMQNIRPMATRWPIVMRKLQYIISDEASDYLLLPVKNYVLLRRFSAKEEKRRLIAAPFLFEDYKDYEKVGFENHLNYIHRPGGEISFKEAFGLSALFNCKLLDIYFRTLNGNTQVSATELRSIPLPSAEIINLLSDYASSGQRTHEEIDEWIKNKLKVSGEEFSEQDRRSTRYTESAWLAPSTTK